MPSYYRQSRDWFEVIDGYLVRTVASADGRGYRHRCSLEAFQTVAQAFDEPEQPGHTSETLVAALGLPHTPVNVAMEFLRERGCVVTRNRRCYPAGRGVYLDGMIEYSALAEEPEPA